MKRYPFSDVTGSGAPEDAPKKDVYKLHNLDLERYSYPVAAENLTGKIPDRLLFRGFPGGRLTLATDTPVMVSDVSNATVIRYTPYKHNGIPIRNVGVWSMRRFSELTNDTTQSSTGNAGPAAVAASSVYDLFVWDNAGTLTLTRGPAWTSDTARSAGTALTRVEGTLVNDVAITNGPDAQRGTYVGTVRSDSGSTIDWELGGKAAGGDPAFLYVWNMYNRVDVRVEILESTVSWTYAAGVLAWRSLNSSTGNRASWVTGLEEDVFEANVSANASGGVPYVGIGFDSVTVRSGSSHFRTTGAGNVIGGTVQSGLGAHFFQAIEFNNSGGAAALFYGDIGIPLIAQNGFFMRGKF